MFPSSKVEHLIVDTSAFIKNVPLQELADNVITEESVITEVKSKRQLRRLVVLPYNLTIKNVYPEHIKTVTEFAKKTGDYRSLSSTDIRVIALTLQTQIEKVGKDGIKLAPTTARTLPLINSKPLDHPKCIAGFFIPRGRNHSDVDDHDHDDNDDGDHDHDDNDDSDHNHDDENDDDNNDDDHTPDDPYEGLSLSALIDIDIKAEVQKIIEAGEKKYSKDIEKSNQVDQTDLAEKFKNLDCNAEEIELDDKEHTVDDILAPVKIISDNENEDFGDDGNDDDDDDDDQNNDEGEDSDEDGWITPSNIVKTKKAMDADTLSEQSVKVACITTDFAMQNVLKQMGLHVAALDGRIIKQLRTYIFRCYACFKKTSRMDLIFCPNCGMKTLKKVAVSLDENGTEHIHINYRKQLPVRGKRFPLPTPKGGKHANNPILSADQPVPDQRVSKLARMKNNPLNDDYIAGYSPFMTRDVYSKSAMLGLRLNCTNNAYWMKKNPNECKKKRK